MEKLIENLNEKSKNLKTCILNSKNIEKKYKKNQYVSYSNYILNLSNEEYQKEYGNINELF